MLSMHAAHVKRQIGGCLEAGMNDHERRRARGRVSRRDVARTFGLTPLDEWNIDWTLMAGPREAYDGARQRVGLGCVARTPRYRPSALASAMTRMASGSRRLRTVISWRGNG